MNFIWDKSTKIQYSGLEKKSIRHFLQVLERDMDMVFIKTENYENTRIVISLVEDVTFEAEQFITQVNDTELELIANDELGIIYGILYLSEHYLGIDKFWFWNDKTPNQVEQIFITDKFYQSSKAITRFRGWFINDEVLIAKWQVRGSNEYVWEMVFEALLRCGGNMVIAGTDIEDPIHKNMATNMGLWITHHHAEPLGSRMFSRVYPELKASYRKNKELFQSLWREAVNEQKDKKVIWNVGFRGQGDYPFWYNDSDFDTDEKRGKLISQIIKDQISIISEKQPNPICCVNLYGEIAELYKGGNLQLPENVIKIWADSGYGKMVSRRQDNHNPRVPAIAQEEDKGPHGIYYHVTFYDLQASNHLTMLPNTPEFVNKELNHAFDHHMTEFLIVNCGNIRPHLYYLDLVSNIWQHGNMDIASFNDVYFNRYFGADAGFMKDMYQEFQKCIVHYGNYADERAGEQLYYYGIRHLAHAWLTQSEQADGLYWLTGERPIAGQVTFILNLVNEHYANWKKLYFSVHKRLNEKQELTVEEKRIWNQFYIQVQIHYKGLRALKYFTEAYNKYVVTDYYRSFIKLNQAKIELHHVVNSMGFATHEKWTGFYDNDCLTNVSLAEDIVVTVKKFVRMVGDGPYYYTWEREHVMSDSERSVVLLTNKTKQLKDDEFFIKVLNEED